MNKICNSVKLGNNLNLGENITIKDNVIIGNNVTIQDNLSIGSGTKIWDNSYIRSSLGDNCVVARGVYIDASVPIGNNVKIQNRNNITHGVTLEDGVFVGPNVTFSNDKYPRSINAEETIKSNTDWVCVKTLVKKGSSLGGGCVVVCGVEIGEWALVGAGAVVVKNVPNYAMVVGNPAKIIKWISKSGFPMSFQSIDSEKATFYCNTEEREYFIPIEDYKKSL